MKIDELDYNLPDEPLERRDEARLRYFSPGTLSGPNCGRIVGLGSDGRSRISGALLLMAIVSCGVHIGCRAVGVQTIWSSEVRSPDGLWLASAKTEHHGGFGSAGIVTSVYLERTNISDPPIEILGFFHNEDNAADTINLAMKWTSTSHLDVTYNGRASLDFQATKCGGVEISLRILSGNVAETLPQRFGGQVFNASYPQPKSSEIRGIMMEARTR